MPLLTQKPSTRVEKTTSMALNFHSAYLRDYVIGSESVNYRLVMRLKKNVESLPVQPCPPLLIPSSPTSSSFVSESRVALLPAIFDIPPFLSIVGMKFIKRPLSRQT